jgi:hypothetical protein
MLKFRTMVVNAEALQPALEDANEADGPVFKIALTRASLQSASFSAARRSTNSRS